MVRRGSKSASHHEPAEAGRADEEELGADGGDNEGYALQTIVDAIAALESYGDIRQFTALL
jgi:hypothetical protein